MGDIIKVDVYSNSCNILSSEQGEQILGVISRVNSFSLAALFFRLNRGSIFRVNSKGNVLAIADIFFSPNRGSNFLIHTIYLCSNGGSIQLKLSSERGEYITIPGNGVSNMVTMMVFPDISDHRSLH